MLRLLAKRFAILAISGALPVVLSTCEIFDPCPLRADDSKFLDGQWDLSTVDGKAIGTGYALPFGAGTLLRGNLTFSTFYVDAGSCAAPKHSSGEVVALYQLSGGATKTEVGSFEFDNPTNAVTLRALGHEAQATASLGAPSPTTLFGHSSMTLIAPIPVPALGTVDYTLVFDR